MHSIDIHVFVEALQSVGAKVVEDEPRAYRQVANGPTGKHVPGFGHGTDPRTDVHRQPAPVVAPSLALARVDADPDPKAPCGQRRRQFQSELTRPSRCVEDREHPVARMFGASAAVLIEEDIDDFVVDAELLAPARITLSAEHLGRTHDVGEQHGGEYTVRSAGSCFIADELECLCHQDVADVEAVVRSGRKRSKLRASKGKSMQSA